MDEDELTSVDLRRVVQEARTRHALRRAWEISELEPVNARPPFREYLYQLWDRRHFIKMYSFAQAMGQHQGTLLGNIWLVLAPLLDGAMYWFIFGVVFQASRGNPDFLPRLIIGILLFSFFSRSMTGCANSVRGGRGLIRAFSFPRAALPAASLTRDVIAQVPSFLTMLVLILLVPPHAHITWTWLLAPLPLLLMTGFCAGIGLVLARLTHHAPDIGKLIPYVTRLLLYVSGVIFAVERFSEHQTVLTLIMINPVYLYIEMTRTLLLTGALPDAHQWVTLLLWSVGTLVAGIWFFWAGEVSYGRHRS